MDKPLVLLVDDDGESVVSLSRALHASGLDAQIHGASREEEVLRCLTKELPQVVVLDLSLDRRGVESGYDLLKKILAHDSTIRVVVLTGHADIAHGVRALQLGAANFLEKPADAAHLVAIVNDGITQSTLRRAYQNLRHEQQAAGLEELVGTSAAMSAVREQVLYCAHTLQSVLICGETGTGKGLCARAIHKNSTRSAKPFVRYQTSFSTPDLVNSELFGHLKGAFTGATTDRRGLMMEAQGGTLFLDEIDTLPSETQIALLGVLQDRMVRPVGGNREEPVDFRLLAASNANLEKCLDSGKLRHDFYHRAAHVTILLPPLRARREDIDCLARFILERMYQREQLEVREISEPALADLRHYDWPGNVRQLEAVIEGAAWKAHYYGRRIIETPDISLPTAPRDVSESAANFTAQVESFKLHLIESALKKHDRNQVHAARELGLDRSTLRRILARQDP